LLLSLFPFITDWGLEQKGTKKTKRDSAFVAFVHFCSFSLVADGGGEQEIGGARQSAATFSLVAD
jgi:hypothetical protein